MKICAQKWKLKINSSDKDEAISEFLDHISKDTFITDYIDTLPENLIAALEFMLHHNGKFPAQQYTHQFGSIRVMGPARRDRENHILIQYPLLKIYGIEPLLATHFLNVDSVLEEYFYIPDR